jgi:hypothetical protein
MGFAFLGALIAGIAVFAGIYLYTTFTWGLVVYKFWYWFIIPVFTTVPHVNYIQAIGLMLFISLFKNHHSDSKSSNLMLFLTPWVVLFLGWLTNIFILN